MPISRNFNITVQNGRTCEAHRDETVLSALTRAGITLSAPCGGRGICGKCTVFLQTGRIQLIGEKELNPGNAFSACKGIALSDITIELPKENTGLINSFKKQNVKKVLRAGIGLDIGTTTVQLELVDLDTGESLETISAFNAQRSFGADVMSRINAARNGKTKELFNAINRQTEEMLQQCIGTWNLAGIEHCVVSANTTMLHLFCGVDPSGLGEIPFTPVFLEERHFPGKELCLSADTISLLPGISAFVGADIVSGLAFLNIADHKENTLFADIGTNGEIVLWKAKEHRLRSSRRLLCTSTAAGPCFEGAEISCGMSAVPGAINRIEINEQSRLVISTLDNIPPRGICGSGLIDAIAAMKAINAIDETGALEHMYIESGFPVAEGIAISQRDIRRFQLAKSAILSGITVLSKRAGLENMHECGTVYIAGALGFFINPDNAVIAGLLPPEFAEKSNIVVCGNTSLKGAVKCLLDPSFLPYCRNIVALSDTVNLASETDFSEAFAENMLF